MSPTRFQISNSCALANGTDQNSGTCQNKRNHIRFCPKHVVRSRQCTATTPPLRRYGSHRGNRIVIARKTINLFRSRRHCHPSGLPSAPEPARFRVRRSHRLLVDIRAATALLPPHRSHRRRQCGRLVTGDCRQQRRGRRRRCARLGQLRSHRSPVGAHRARLIGRASRSHGRRAARRLQSVRPESVHRRRRSHRQMLVGGAQEIPLHLRRTHRHRSVCEILARRSADCVVLRRSLAAHRRCACAERWRWWCPAVVGFRAFVCRIEGQRHTVGLASGRQCDCRGVDASSRQAVRFAHPQTVATVRDERGRVHFVGIPWQRQLSGCGQS